MPKRTRQRGRLRSDAIADSLFHAPCARERSRPSCFFCTDDGWIRTMLMSTTISLSPRVVHLSTYQGRTNTRNHRGYKLAGKMLLYCNPDVQACRLMLELLPHACEDPKAHAQESVRSRLWNNWSVHLVAQILRCCSKIAYFQVGCA